MAHDSGAYQFSQQILCPNCCHHESPDQASKQKDNQYSSKQSCFLTDDGKNTLTYFENDISQDIRTEVLQYLAARGASTKNQVKAPADYYINNQGEYVVHLQLLQKGASVIDLSLAAPSLSAAKAMCRQWPKKYEEIYAKIMEGLL